MYKLIGTTSPIFVSRDPQSTPKTVRSGQDYFVIMIHSAQAAFHGKIWDKVNNLIVTSQVNLNHRNLGNGCLTSINRTVAVRKNGSQPLGLNPNLISLVPAVMPNVTIGIGFIIDKQNEIVKLSGMINDNCFFNALSLAVGPASVAKNVAGIADKIIREFIKPEDQEPILDFYGDFNIATGDLKDGYYVIIGTSDDATPLPDPSIRVEVKNNKLFVGGTPADKWSYVILDVQRIPARAREMNDSASWDLKLREAEDDAELLVRNPIASEDDRKQTWNRCLKLIQESQTLLRADVNYLPKDATNIVTASLQRCRQVIDPNSPERATKGFKQGDSVWMPDISNDLTALGLPPETNINKVLEEYADQVFETRRALKAAGII